MNKSNLLFLDTETTGTGPQDRLCQVAYKFGGQEFDELFKPPLPIEVGAMSVSHITNKMVADKPAFLDSAMHKHLAELFAAGNILVAHNAKFDVEMLRREGLEVAKTIDTLKIAQFVDQAGEVPKYNMQYLRYHHGLEVENATAHNALGDIRVLEELFNYYFEKMLPVVGDEEKVIETMVEISARPVLYKRFNFGKYLNRNIAEVAIEDANYLSWLLNQKIIARERGEENDEDWIYTLDYYLYPKK